MDMTRDDHLSWCKQRALEYVTHGDLPSAVASMVSDLRKHPAFNNETTVAMALVATNYLMNGAGPDAIRRWIEGFR